LIFKKEKEGRKKIKKTGGLLQAILYSLFICHKVSSRYLQETFEQQSEAFPLRLNLKQKKNNFESALNVYKVNYIF